MAVKPIPVKKAKQVPLGKPLELSEEEWDRMAQPTEADIQAAAALWQRAVPPRYSKLLDAEEVKD